MECTHVHNNKVNNSKIPYIYGRSTAVYSYIPVGTWGFSFLSFFFFLFFLLLVFALHTFLFPFSGVCTTAVLCILYHGFLDTIRLQVVWDGTRIIHSLVKEYRQLNEAWPVEFAEVSFSAFQHVRNVIQGMIVSAFFSVSYSSSWKKHKSWIGWGHSGAPTCAKNLRIADITW